MKVLVTGTEGFIGSHVALKLLERGDEAIGFDNLSDCYGISLKTAPLVHFKDHPGYTPQRLQAGDVPDTEADVSELIEQVGYRPAASVENGITFFIEWYRHYFGIKS